MNRVQQLEQEIEQLEEAEFFELASLVHEMEARRWERQLDEDSASGVLDRLFEEAEQERHAGTLKPWPGTD